MRPPGCQDNLISPIGLCIPGIGDFFSGGSKTQFRAEIQSRLEK
jgi:hypothetical protein